VSICGAGSYFPYGARAYFPYGARAYFPYGLVPTGSGPRPRPASRPGAAGSLARCHAACSVLHAACSILSLDRGSMLGSSMLARLMQHGAAFRLHHELRCVLRAVCCCLACTMSYAASWVRGCGVRRAACGVRRAACCCLACMMSSSFSTLSTLSSLLPRSACSGPSIPCHTI
jgi:hypothetical protein